MVIRSGSSASGAISPGYAAAAMRARPIVSVLVAGLVALLLVVAVAVRVDRSERDQVDASSIGARSSPGTTTSLGSRAGRTPTTAGTRVAGAGAATPDAPWAGDSDGGGRDAAGDVGRLGGATIDTEGDVDADTRAAYVRLNHDLRPVVTPERPWVVHYVVTAAGEPSVPVEQLATLAARTYADPRGWSLGGAIRFVRVWDQAEADLVLVIAEAGVIPEYSESCVFWATGEPDASCTVGNTVIINEQRWLHGALGDPFPLDRFRIHELNHETGHWLGQGHFSCIDGGPAAVDQQQFRSLDGCAANEWPLPWEQAMVAERWALWV